MQFVTYATDGQTCCYSNMSVHLVCLSHLYIVSKWLKLSSSKQQWIITQWIITMGLFSHTDYSIHSGAAIIVGMKCNSADNSDFIQR